MFQLLALSVFPYLKNTAENSFMLFNVLVVIGYILFFLADDDSIGIAGILIFIGGFDSGSYADVPRYRGIWPVEAGPPEQALPSRTALY